MPSPRVRLPFDGSPRLTQSFGARPEVYKQFGLVGHNGIDWGTRVGTPILAVADGKAVEIAFKDDAKGADANGFGNYVKLEHAWGQSLYAHLSKVDLKKSDTIKEGAQLGLSGNTGFSSGPHLHFGMRVSPYNTSDGWRGYTNPAWFLVGAGFNEAVDSAQLADLNRKLEAAQQSETTVRQELAAAQSGFDFQRQELTTQADLYRERVSDLLRRYAGQIPPSTDLLSSLEILVQKDAWNFERQELTAQANLWREKVIELLRRYMPGQLPANADPLATLDALMKQWSEELKQARSSQLAGLAASFAASLPPVEDTLSSRTRARSRSN